MLRILHLHARQLQAWERAGLVAATDQYSFEELGQLRTVRDLRATRISAKSIRHSIDAMQRVAGMRNPLLEASAVRQGARVAFRHAGLLVDPVTQQLAFDFAVSTSDRMRVVRPVSVDPARQAADLAAEVQEMFQRAVLLEEHAATIPIAMKLYGEILDLRPQHAPAAINLGTIHYNLRHFARAEELYRSATMADPDYALAFFDLGNVLDEMQRLCDAIAAYQRAIVLVPTYADAHYNLALAYERQGHRRRALRHWMAYVRLDPIGPWAMHARGQARKTLATERLAIVCRRGCPVQQAS